MNNFETPKEGNFIIWNSPKTCLGKIKSWEKWGCYFLQTSWGVVSQCKISWETPNVFQSFPVISWHYDNNLRYSGVGYFVSHRDVITFTGCYIYIISLGILYKYNIPENMNKKYNIAQISDCCRRKYLSTEDKRFSLPQNRDVKVGYFG